MLHRSLTALTIALALIVATSVVRSDGAVAAPSAPRCAAPAVTGGLGVTKMRLQGRGDAEIDQFLQSHFNLVRVSGQSTLTAFRDGPQDEIDVVSPTVYAQMDDCT